MERFVLEVNHYRKEYGDHIAVRDLSLSTGAAAAQVLSSATSLEAQAATLRTQVQSFLSRVRAG